MLRLGRGDGRRASADREGQSMGSATITQVRIGTCGWEGRARGRRLLLVLQFFGLLGLIAVLVYGVR